MNRCVDENIGELITQYELGQLGDQDRERFEAHIGECSFCRRELEKMAPVISEIWLHKDELLKKLHEEGYHFKDAREELRSFLSEERLKREKDAWSVRRFFDNLLRPRILVPAAGSVAVIALVLLLTSPVANHHDKLPYPLRPPYEGESELLLRDNTLMSGEQSFRRGISDYSSNDFRGAVSKLQKAVANQPDNGEWWLYLGVSCYLDGEYDQAIKALVTADSLISSVYKPHARWYLAQAYLQIGRSDEAQRLLLWLSDQGDSNIYIDKAEMELSKMQTNK
jgi:tetratricopeptide (TPR) repeat protein